MIGFYHSVLGLHVGAFDDGQQVALHAFARDIRATRSRSTLARNFVYFVEEDDSHRLDALQRVSGDIFLVDQLLQLLGQEDAASFGDFHAPFLLALGQHVLEHLGEIVDSFRSALRHHHVEHHRRLLGHLDFDLALVELTLGEQRFEFFPRPLVAHF